MTYNQLEILLDKSNRKYDSALSDYQKGNYDSAISSLYYSAFQSLLMLLLSRGILSKKHTDVRAFLNRDLVRTGKISVELGKMFNKLLSDREKADYSLEVTFTKNDVDYYLRLIPDFNQIVRELINSSNDSR